MFVQVCVVERLSVHMHCTYSCLLFVCVRVCMCVSMFGYAHTHMSHMCLRRFCWVCTAWHLSTRRNAQMRRGAPPSSMHAYACSFVDLKSWVCPTIVWPTVRFWQVHVRMCECTCACACAHAHIWSCVHAHLYPQTCTHLHLGTHCETCTLSVGCEQVVLSVSSNCMAHNCR